jgi:hypothetical protein
MHAEQVVIGGKMGGKVNDIHYRSPVLRITHLYDTLSEKATITTFLSMNVNILYLQGFSLDIIG